jgi:8-oxo-dGTP diphosphatase
MKMRTSNYVCGFLFDCEAGRVALIKKNKPDFQAGKLNGIGGKVESHEAPLEAMVREFREETGACIANWSRYCTLNVAKGPATIDFFVSTSGEGVELQTTTDEKVGWYSLRDSMTGWLAQPHMRNLDWLIPLALEHLDNHKLAHVLSEKP